MFWDENGTFFLNIYKSKEYTESSDILHPGRFIIPENAYSIESKSKPCTFISKHDAVVNQYVYLDDKFYGHEPEIYSYDNLRMLDYTVKWFTGKDIKLKKNENTFKKWS